jgi:hypothetical protein
VVAVAWPITEAAGHAAGLDSNTEARHAFWSVGNLEGSLWGSSTLTLEMFALYGPAG